MCERRAGGRAVQEFSVSSLKRSFSTEGAGRRPKGRAVHKDDAEREAVELPNKGDDSVLHVLLFVQHERTSWSGTVLVAVEVL